MGRSGGKETIFVVQQTKTSAYKNEQEAKKREFKIFRVEVAMKGDKEDGCYPNTERGYQLRGNDDLLTKQGMEVRIKHGGPFTNQRLQGCSKEQLFANSCAKGIENDVVDFEVQLTEQVAKESAHLLKNGNAYKKQANEPAENSKTEPNSQLSTPSFTANDCFGNGNVSGEVDDEDAYEGKSE